MINYFDLWGASEKDLNKIIGLNPSLRGILFGYIAEYKLRELWFPKAGKLDDHDRTKKGDLIVDYNGVSFSVESKSLQTNSVRGQEDCFLGEEFFTGKVQCDASDCRTVKLPNGEEVETTCLMYGEFDILAINLFSFFNKWVFCFIRNSNLPHTTSSKYTKEQQKYLISTSLEVSWPLSDPFYDNPYNLMEKL
jgi:hypothetical protein